MQIKLQDKCRVCEGKMIFDDVLEIKNGRNQKNVKNPNGKYPIYGSGGIMGYADDYICEAGTVIIGRKGSINNPIYVEEPFWNIDTAFGLSAKREILMPRYLYYFCQYFDFERLNKAVTIPSLTKSDLLKIELELPTIETQKKIVDRLIKVEQIIQLKKRELQKLDTLVKSRFVELFGDPVINSMGWKKALIGDDCFVTKLAGFEYTQYINYEDSGDVVMVKAQNVKNGKLNRKELSFISNEVSDSLPRSQLAPGDVVMTYVGANIGDVAIIDNEYKYHLAPNVAKIRPDSERYNSIYFMYMLMLLNAYIVKNSADTAKAALGMERIRKLNVFVPPIELQNQFADFVASVDKSKSKIQKSLEETQLLFDSLMQKYFG